MNEMSRSEFLRRVFLRLGVGANFLWPIGVLAAAGFLIYYLGSFFLNTWDVADAISKVEIAVSVNQQRCPSPGNISVVLTNASDKQLVQADIYAVAVSPEDESGTEKANLRLGFRGSIAPGESQGVCKFAPDTADKIQSEKMEWKIRQEAYTFYEL